jgi:hypothetical protein
MWWQFGEIPDRYGRNVHLTGKAKKAPQSLSAAESKQVKRRGMEIWLQS